jgi:ribosomal protein L29
VLFSRSFASDIQAVQDDESKAVAVDNSQYPNAPIRKFFEETKLPQKQDGTPQPIPTGRPWFASELRGKSFEDLHKLHFVLLIERNKLLSEKVRHRKYNLIFPSPQRLKNVRVSMARLQTVLTERGREVEMERAVAKAGDAEATPASGEVEQVELTDAQDKWFRAHRHLKKSSKQRVASGRASGGQKTRRRMTLAKEFETQTLEYIADLESTREKVLAAAGGDASAARILNPPTVERPRWRNLSETAQVKMKQKQIETRAEKLQKQFEQSQSMKKLNTTGEVGEFKTPKWSERPELAGLFLRRQPQSSQPRKSVKGRKSDAKRKPKN